MIARIARRWAATPTPTRGRGPRRRASSILARSILARRRHFAAILGGVRGDIGGRGGVHGGGRHGGGGVRPFAAYAPRRDGAAAAPRVRLSGRISRVLFQRPDLGLVIALLRVDAADAARHGADATVKIVAGNRLLAAAFAGERVLLEGRFDAHAKYGKQFTVAAVAPAQNEDGTASHSMRGDAARMRAFLASNLTSNDRAVRKRRARSQQPIRRAQGTQPGR